MPELGDKIFRDANIQTLLDVMESLDVQTKNEIIKAVGKKLTQSEKNGIVNKIKALIQTTDPQIKDWIAQAVSESYINGLEQADKELGRKKQNITLVEIKTLKELSIHADAINALMSDAYLDFANGMNGIQKGAEHILNEALKQQIRAKVVSNVLSGSDIRNTKRDIIQLLSERGFSVLTDRGGRTWTLKRYSEMIARTHTIKAFNEATINRAGQFGVDLIQISTHSGACPLCTPYEGKIYSLSGMSKTYPRYSVIPPIHPNCKHVLQLRPDLQNENDIIE